VGLQMRDVTYMRKRMPKMELPGRNKVGIFRDTVIEEDTDDRKRWKQEILTTSRNLVSNICFSLICINHRHLFQDVKTT